MSFYTKFKKKKKSLSPTPISSPLLRRFLFPSKREAGVGVLGSWVLGLGEEEIVGGSGRESENYEFLKFPLNLIENLTKLMKNQ